MTSAYQTGISEAGPIEGDNSFGYGVLYNNPKVRGEDVEKGNIGENGNNIGVDVKDSMREWKRGKKGTSVGKASECLLKRSSPDVVQCDTATQHNAQIRGLVLEGEVGPGRPC
jgi:hypothetical protein